MNKFLIILAALSSTNTFAGDTDFVVSCMQQAIKISYEGGAISSCRGVKSEEDVKAVIGCLKEAIKISWDGTANSACMGVKN